MTLTEDTNLLVINYTGLEPIVDNTVAGTVQFTFTGAAEAISIDNHANNALIPDGFTRIDLSLIHI